MAHGMFDQKSASNYSKLLTNWLLYGYNPKACRDRHWRVQWNWTGVTQVLLERGWRGQPSPQNDQINNGKRDYDLQERKRNNRN
jgi:hypothetical protein